MASVTVRNWTSGGMWTPVARRAGGSWEIADNPRLKLSAWVEVGHYLSSARQTPGAEAERVVSGKCKRLWDRRIESEWDVGRLRWSGSFRQFEGQAKIVPDSV